MINPDDQYQTAYYFLQDVQYYCGGTLPENYLETVGQPMSLASITQKICTGCYDSPREFVEDCRLVVTNCHKFYADESDEAKFMVVRANRLRDAMAPLLDKLLKFDSSAKGTAAREKAFLRVMTIKKPERKFLKEIMVELRAMEYTDKQAKVRNARTCYVSRELQLRNLTDDLCINYYLM